MENIVFDFISKYITLSEDEKKEFLLINTFKSFKKGTILLNEGQLSDECYFILEGCFKKLLFFRWRRKNQCVLYRAGGC